MVDEVEDDDPYSSFDSTPNKKKFDSFQGFKPPNKEQEKDIDDKSIEVDANLNYDLNELAEVEIQSDDLINEGKEKQFMMTSPQGTISMLTVQGRNSMQETTGTHAKT